MIFMLMGIVFGIVVFYLCVIVMLSVMCIWLVGNCVVVLMNFEFGFWIVVIVLGVLLMFVSLMFLLEFLIVVSVFIELLLFMLKRFFRFGCVEIMFLVIDSVVVCFCLLFCVLMSFMFGNFVSLVL